MIESQQVYQNTSGKFIQFPLRLSNDFKWQPMEKIKLLHEKRAEHNNSTKEDGWIVFNMDYCGNERCFETAWIDNKTLTDNFTLIK
jgi:hypothetical protein